MSNRTLAFIGLVVGLAIGVGLVDHFGAKDGGAIAALLAVFGIGARAAQRERARAQAAAQAQVDRANAQRDRAQREAAAAQARGEASAAAAERSTTRAPVTRTEIDSAKERWMSRKRPIGGGEP